MDGRWKKGGKLDFENISTELSAICSAAESTTDGAGCSMISELDKAVAEASLVEDHRNGKESRKNVKPRRLISGSSEDIRKISLDKRTSGSTVKKSQSENSVSSSMLSNLSCSVIQSSAPSSIDTELAADSGATPGVVTIGFNNGLASVTSFAYPPTDNNNSSTVGQHRKASLESEWSFLGSEYVKRDANSLSTKKLETETKSLDSAMNITCPEFPNVTAEQDEGVLTQTRQDIICPGCGLIFPPESHLKFLDHFEECQKDYKDYSKNTSFRMTY